MAQSRMKEFMCQHKFPLFQIQTAALWVTAAVNLAAAGLGVFLLTRMFHSEKVIFSR